MLFVRADKVAASVILRIFLVWLSNSENVKRDILYLQTNICISLLDSKSNSLTDLNDQRAGPGQLFSYSFPSSSWEQSPDNHDREVNLG